MKNELARTLFLAGEKVQYDTQCKKVLGHRVILAWILKYTMEEFHEYSVDEIACCIEGKPEISAVKMAPGGTNAERITGNINESREQDEGEIYFDIRFFVFLPESRETIRLLINVEAQKSFYPGYEIITRGIFYAARMISAQLGTEFSIPDYDSIKKVCSIWLCLNAPKYIGNAMSEYTITKRDIEGWQPDRPFAYLKMEVCVVTLNENKATDNRFLEMLNVLLSKNMPYVQKEKLLKNKFHIKMESGFGKELRCMCNLSDYVYESGQKDGMKRGRRQGMKCGMKRGRKQGVKDVVKAMIEEGYSEEAIMKVARITPGQYKSWRAEITV